MKYYYISVNAGICTTSRTVRTEKGIEAIKEHVTHDKTYKKGIKARLSSCKEVDQKEYDSFINCFEETEKEKVIAGTTI